MDLRDAAIADATAEYVAADFGRDDDAADQALARLEARVDRALRVGNPMELFVGGPVAPHSDQEWDGPGVPETY